MVARVRGPGVAPARCVPSAARHVCRTAAARAPRARPRHRPPHPPARRRAHTRTPTMHTITEQALIGQLNWRYATKKFDPARKIPEATFQALMQAARLAPSSYGLQPYAVVIVTDGALRQALRPHSWNQSQVTDASHFMVFAVRTELDQAWVDHTMRVMASARGVERASLAPWEGMVSGFVKGFTSEAAKHEWSAKQLYMAGGVLLTAAALLGVDACPLEGIDPAKYDQVLGLEARRLHALFAVALGYRAADDKHARAAKARLPEGDMFVRL
ncbi:MAG: NAD(P)H-dependent oxidoreductase [Isosphaera sp.]|nr:NAD(P)H-dependent oxidoreductase [Isosphaera sp.]